MARAGKSISVLILVVYLYSPFEAMAAQPRSANFHLQSATFGTAANNASVTFKQSGVFAQGQPVGKPSSLEFLLLSGWLFTAPLRLVGDDLCWPIKTKRNKIVLLCL